MGPATTCPSRKLDFCKLNEKCYALKAERLYPYVLPYRIRQSKYWKKTSAKQIIEDFRNLLPRIRHEVKYLRFNESGDFYNQKDVLKLDRIAKFLKTKGITTYGYTARNDLNFKNVNFLIKGSDHNAGNNGKTIVVPKKEIKERLPPGWKVCPMSCKVCHICKEKSGINIIFPLH